MASSFLRRTGRPFLAALALTGLAYALLGSPFARAAEAQSVPTLSLEHKRYGDDPNPGQVWNTVTSAYEGTTTDQVGQVVSVNINLSQARNKATKFKLCVSDESTAVFRTSPDQIRFLVDFDVINAVGNANSLSWTADNRRQLIMDADNCHDYTIGAGSTLSWVMLFIHSDSVKEGDETAVFELKRSSDTDSEVAISSTKGKSTFTITNDDGMAPTFTVEGGAAVPEGTRATFTLKSDMALSTSPQVIVKASDGGRGDFVSPSTENNLILRNFPTGVTQTTFSVPTVDDSTLEPHGAVKAEILARDGYVVGSPGSATVTVIDNDEHNKQNQAKVSLGQSTYEVLEGRPARIEVTLDKARSSDTAVTLTKTAISPTTTADFGDSTTSYTVTVTATETSAIVEMPTATDSVNDHGETFRVEIQSVATGTQKGSVTQTTVTIQEPAVYQMARGHVNVQEGGENWVDVTRTKGLSNPASTDVTVTVKPGTATAGADYTPDVTAIDVNVNLVNNKGRLNVKGVAENMIEGPETFTVELTGVPEELAGVPESATIGGRLKTTVQIVDVNLVPSDWALLPSGLSDGDQFRLFFVTDTGRTAESADISVYDTFVRDKAKVGHTDIRPYAEGFQVVGSVVGMPAHIHTATSRGTSEITRWSTPIYWVNGKRIATGHNVFWSNNWTNYSRADGDLRNASGNVDTRAAQHWTGTNADGTASTRSLGGGTVGVPQYYDGSFTIHGQWGANPISQRQKPKTETRRLLGISQIFEVTENPILSISAAQMEVTESGSTVNNVRFTVNAVPAPESDLTVSVNLKQTGDYTNQVPADGSVDLDVTIPANSASVIFQIPLLSDGGDEPDGILAASISSTSIYRVVGGSQRVEVTLKDDDDTNVALTTSRQWMNETGSDNSLDLTLTLSRPAGSRETVIIPIKVSEAMAGTDYTVSLKTGARLLTSGGISPRNDPYSAQNPAVEFSPGTSSATITFTAVDDSVKANRVLKFGYGFNSFVDADELGLGGGGMTLGNLNRYQQATILDDENTDPVEVTFSIAEFQFVEGNGSGAAPVIFFSRPVAQDVTVRLNLTPGTATKGVDYIDADHINFLVLAGKTVSTRTIRVFDDDIWEVDEIFNMAIDAASLPAGFILGDKPTATVKILDDETAQNANINHNLTIENLAAQTTEGGSGADRVAMTFSIMPATDGPGKISVCLTGTATPGEDYRFRTNGQGYRAPDADGCVVAGLGAGGSTQHYLEIIDDSVKEVDETIILTLRKHPETISDVGVPQTSTTHTIVDNDDPAATFETAAQQVQESAGSVSVPLAMTPLGPDQPTTVNYQVVGMTATAGSDYTAPSGTVTVPAGDTSASIPINLVDDSTAEFPEEIMVKLSGGTGYQLGERQQHEIEVVDSDPGVLVGLSQRLASVSATATCADLPGCIVEGHGSVTVTVRDGTGYMAQPGRNTATVEVRDDDPPVISIAAGNGVTEGGTAGFTLTAAPAPQQSLDVIVRVGQQGDYVAPGNIGLKTVTIPANQASVAYNVPTMPDSADEVNGAVIVTVQARAGYEIGARSAHVAVADDDQLTISVEDGPSVETGDPARFTVVASLPPTADLVVRLNVTESGGVVAAAHRGQKQVTIPAGKTKATYSIPSVANNQLSGSATVTVVSGSGYAVSASGGAATVLIDDDLPRVSVSQDAWVPGGGTARFIVTVQPDQVAPLTVNVVVSQGQYPEVVDPDGAYDVGTHEVTIPIGGSAAIEVATTADDKRSKHGAITAEVTPGSGYLVSDTDSTTVVSVRTDDPCWYGHKHLEKSFHGNKISQITWTMDECHGKDDMGASHHTNFVWTSCPVYTGEESKREWWNKVHPERRHLLMGNHTIDEPFLNSLNVDQNHYHDGTQTIFGDGYCGSGNGWTPGDPVKPDKGSSGDPIGAPGKPAFSEVTSGSVTVSWPQRDVDHYLLYWGPVADGNQLQLPHVQVDSSAQSHTVTGLEPGTSYGFTVYSDDDQPVALTEYETTAGGTPPPATPEVSITADGDIGEGGDAAFTLMANPAPATALVVTVSVTASGDYGVTPGSQTVTIPTSGSAPLSIATSDDSTDEADGSVTTTVNTGAGYTVSATAGTATVAVADDDPTACTPTLPSDAVTVSEVTGWRDGHSGASHVLRWNRVLEALGEDTGSGATPLTAAESEDNESTFMFSRWDRVTRTLEAIEQCDNPPPPPPPTPVVSITADGDITEGGNAGFTVSANPAPTSALDVTVNVAQSGDYGVTPGSQTVTIATSGTGTLTVSTSDDSADEPDGSVTATVNDGADYDVSATAGAATVAVADDDDPPPPSCTPNLPADAVTVSEVTDWRDGHPGAAHVLRWNRVLEALGEDTGTGATAMTATESQANENQFMRSRWDRVTRTLEAIEQCDTTTVVPPPVVSITSDGDITEGGNATYTLTANPAPTSALTVTVSVTQSGDYGVVTGSRTVTISTGGTGTLSVATIDDSVDESDGSVTATVTDGTDYDVSATAGTATAAVSDDDTTTVVPPPPATPEISITADGDITEGGDATFTLTASPAPTSPLDVEVTIAQSGDFGVTPGSRTVTISTGGTGTLTVTTDDDSVDEADGSVTAAVASGTDYTVSTTAGAATVAVSDDDDAPPPPATPEISITADGDITEGGDATFTLTANPAPTSPLDVEVTIAQSGDFGVATGSRTVTISTGGTGTLTLATTGDTTDEPDGSVTATIDDGADYDVSATAGAATVAVADDDPAPLSVTNPTISSSDASAREDAGTMEFTVSLSAPSVNVIKVRYSVGRGTAYRGRDFEGVYAELVFQPGETTKTVTIVLIDDDLVEGDEIFGFWLSYARGGATIPDNHSEGTIIDND